jgi:hypothetical protein
VVASVDMFPRQPIGGLQLNVVGGFPLVSMEKTREKGVGGRTYAEVLGRAGQMEVGPSMPRVTME